ncbi:Hemolysin-type calcium-binding repeat-containing protein [Rhizobium aethiopicum]|uniref:Hemolysin-type calcium-binding repeat-containing protein n=1 Tax=Rhizobium aethiopicum TaxID=1138170 RepID=A0A1C3XVJ0_9HYPH|nr:metal-binding protein [Rhizobium aethiopicum]SCB56245.1 Hemolysin-type calcium-binding repeat-containing protein [Rhizobium aethiopicum]
MALHILDTNGATVTKTGAEFEAYDVIRYSAANPLSAVALTVSDSSVADLADELGSVSASVRGSSGPNTITTGAGDDTIVSGGGADTLSGGAGNDLLNGEAGNDLLNGGDGNDKIYGGVGNDVIKGGAGDDAISDGDYFSDVAETFNIDAGDGNDKLILFNDTFLQISGTVDGGDGNDTLEATNLNDLTIKNVEILQTGVFATFASTAQLEYFDKITGSSSDSSVNLVLTDGAHLDLSDELAGDRNYISGNNDVSGIDLTTGSTQDNVIGTAANDIIDTGDGNDYINGNTGDDRLDAGKGDDEIFGDAGNDVIRAGAGNDIIFDGDSFGFSPEVFDIDAGDGDDVITLQTPALSGTIDGGAGIDTLRAPWLSGLTIKNIEILETAGSLVSGSAAQFESFDKIVYSNDPSENLPAALSLTDSAHLDLSDELGNGAASIRGTVSGIDVKTAGGDDQFTGTDGHDIFDAGAGNDTIIGNGGNDKLIGGDGNDTITDGGFGGFLPEVFDIDAGDGDDAITVETFTPQVSGTIDGGAGIDTLQASSLRGLTIDNIEVLKTAGWLVAGSSAQFESFDKIVYSDNPADDYSPSLALTDSAHLDLSDELGDRGAFITGYVSGIDVKTGGGNDDFTGTDGNDVFHGNGGNDIINGKAGDDVIRGGTGDDTITDGDNVSTAPEAFDIDAGDGNDAINLQSHSSALSGTVDGGAGTDTLRVIEPTLAPGMEFIGLAGLTIKNVEVLETAGAEVLASAAQFESFDKIVIYDEPGYENDVLALTLTDSARADLSDELANRHVHIFGTAFGIDVKTGGGDDYFFGTEGNDRFEGGAGNDVLLGGAGIDTAVFSGNFANYSFAIDNGNHILTSAKEGTDTLNSMEFARFADGIYDLAKGSFTPDANSAPTNIQLSKTVLSEDTPIWTTVGLLSAKDADGDPLTYTLLDGAGDHFRLKGNRIVTSKALDYETAKSHTIKVAVSDGKVTVEKDITINVLDVNEAPLNQAPIKLSFSRSSISENVAIGTSVGLLSAVDPEGGPVKWRLTDDADGIFKLVGNKIQTKAAIDYESTHSLTFTAEAYDAAGNTTSRDFTLAVKDVFELSSSSLLHEALI